LRQQVAETGRFEVDGIGTFTGNEEGKLQFDPSLRHNFFGEAYGMSAISAHSLTAQVLDGVVVATATAVGPVLVKDDDEITLTPIPPSRLYWRVAAGALLVGSLGLISYFSVIKPGQPQQSSLDPGTLLRVPNTLFERPVRVQKTAKPITAFVQKTTVKPVSVASVKPVTVTPAPQPVVPVVTTLPPTVALVTSKPTEVVTPVAVTKPVRTTPYYTVIAGSFSTKRKALWLQEQLRKAGYADAFVMAPARRGYLFKVAAIGSSNQEAAIARVSTISEIAGTTAWIYKN